MLITERNKAGNYEAGTTMQHLLRPTGICAFETVILNTVPNVTYSKLEWWLWQRYLSVFADGWMWDACVC